MASTGTDIADRILEAVLARKLAPGERLGEQPLAMLFDCSRTIVREALTQLATRGIVSASARRGWFVVQPTLAEAREAFEARAVIEQGLIRRTQPLAPEALARLQEHLEAEQQALAAADESASNFLLGDFHVCLAQCLGNNLLAETLRSFTARTTLVTMLYQSHEEAQASCADHILIVDALARGDHAEAESLMGRHLLQVLASLQPAPTTDSLAQLRTALAPVSPPAAARGESSTYLGALL
jgi:DNA-binding GntR family transcriptional regulator